MNTINFEYDKNKEILTISSDKNGLMALKEMIELKLKMRDNIQETLIFKDYYMGKEFKLRFDIV